MEGKKGEESLLEGAVVEHDQVSLSSLWGIRGGGTRVKHERGEWSLGAQIYHSIP